MEIILYFYQFTALILAAIMAIAILKITKKNHLAWIIFIGFAIFIFAPENYSYNQWRKSCEANTGIYIYKSVQVNGYYTQNYTLDYIKDRLDRGYLFIEIDSPKPELGAYKIFTLKNISSGGEFEERLSSEYIMYNIRKQTNNNYDTTETIIQGKQMEILAVSRKLYYYGGALFRGLRLISNKRSEQDWIESCPQNFKTGDLAMQAIPPFKTKKD